MVVVVFVQWMSGERLSVRRSRSVLASPSSATRIKSKHIWVFRACLLLPPYSKLTVVEEVLAHHIWSSCWVWLGSYFFSWFIASTCIRNWNESGPSFRSDSSCYLSWEIHVSPPERLWNNRLISSEEWSRIRVIPWALNVLLSLYDSCAFIWGQSALIWTEATRYCVFNPSHCFQQSSSNRS